jgi:subtilase family serine protease
MAAAAALLVFAFAMSGLAQESKSGVTQQSKSKSQLAGSPIGVPGSVQQSAPPQLPPYSGTLVIPKSSQAQPTPAGHKFAAHTNVELFIPTGVSPDEAPPFGGYGYETPASIGCHYALVAGGSLTGACNPNSTTKDPSGGANSIAVVDAYDDPSAPSDLAWFSLQFGLPLTASQIQVVWANTGASSCPVNEGYGVGVDYTGGWELEEALDVEWAHAMAPAANIYLVEACSDYDTDLLQAVLVANNLVNCGQSLLDPSTGLLGTCPTSNPGMVSMSWGTGEFPGETAYDSYFNYSPLNNIAYFAAAGDGPGILYPCASPYVICAGGTTLRRNPTNFNFMQETAWVFTGSGASAYEPKPTFQNGVTNNGTAFRGVPDVSLDSDPYTGVYVYDTFPQDLLYFYQWWVVGGTSVSVQALAGIVNVASTNPSSGWATSSQDELGYFYQYRANSSLIQDIQIGYCGPYMGISTLVHWDFCTGVGTPNGYGAF